jgi:dihydrodipicolinate synthase/N-acetylneuraminate lyase
LVRSGDDLPIAGLDNVVAFKEASFDIDLFTETMKQLDERRHRWKCSGNDRFVAESYRLGARAR